MKRSRDGEPIEPDLFHEMRENTINNDFDPAKSRRFEKKKQRLLTFLKGKSSSEDQSEKKQRFGNESGVDRVSLQRITREYQQRLDSSWWPPTPDLNEIERLLPSKDGNRIPLFLRGVYYSHQAVESSTLSVEWDDATREYSPEEKKANLYIAGWSVSSNQLKEIKHPVIHLHGNFPNGAPVVVDVHHFRPYLYVKIPNTILNWKEQQHMNDSEFCKLVAKSIEAALDDALKKEEHEDKEEEKPKRKRKRVLRVDMMKRASLMYYTGEERFPFLKITVSIPSQVKQVREILYLQGIGGQWESDFPAWNVNFRIHTVLPPSLTFYSFQKEDGKSDSSTSSSSSSVCTTVNTNTTSASATRSRWRVPERFLRDHLLVCEKDWTKLASCLENVLQPRYQIKQKKITTPPTTSPTISSTSRPSTQDAPKLVVEPPPFPFTWWPKGCGSIYIDVDNAWMSSLAPCYGPGVSSSPLSFSRNRPLAIRAQYDIRRNLLLELPADLVRMMFQNGLSGEEAAFFVRKSIDRFIVETLSHSALTPLPSLPSEVESYIWKLDWVDHWLFADLEKTQPLVDPENNLSRRLILIQFRNLQREWCLREFARYGKEHGDEKDGEGKHGEEQTFSVIWRTLFQLFECNVNFEIRFTLDTGLIPSSFFSVEKKVFSLDCLGKYIPTVTYLETSYHHIAPWRDCPLPPPPVRVFSFDIECDNTGDMFPSAARNNAIQIGVDLSPTCRALFTLDSIRETSGARGAKHEHVDTAEEKERKTIQFWDYPTKDGFVNRVKQKWPQLRAWLGLGGTKRKSISAENDQDDVDNKDLTKLDFNHLEKHIKQKRTPPRNLTKELHTRLELLFGPLPRNEVTKTKSLQERWRMIQGLNDMWKLEERKQAQRMLQDFASFIRLVSPDWIVQYNGDNFDWPFLFNRAQHLDVPSFPFLGRIHQAGVLRINTSGTRSTGKRRQTTVLLPGLENLDTYQYCKKDINLSLPRLTLNDAAAAILGLQKEDVPHSFITDLYQSTDAARQRLGHYCWKDAYLAKAIAMKLNYPLQQEQMSAMVRVPLHLLMSRGQGIRGLSLLISRAKHCNLCVPFTKSVERANPDVDKLETGAQDAQCSGGSVLQPKKGYWVTGAVATLDFQSLYPSLMQAYNLCYTTQLDPSIHRPWEKLGWKWGDTSKFIARCHKKGNVRYYTTKEVYHGIIPQILKELGEDRQRVKKLLQNAKGDQWLLYNAEQNAIKLVMNSIYGFTVGFVLLNRELGADVTGLGREAITKSKEWVESPDFTKFNGGYKVLVLYGDTDSIFIYIIGKDYLVGPVEIAKVAEGAATYVNARFPPPMKLDFEKVLFPYLLERQKGYVGLKYDPKQMENFHLGNEKPRMCAKGLSSVKRDTNKWLKQTEELCYDSLLTRATPELYRILYKVEKSKQLKEAEALKQKLIQETKEIVYDRGAQLLRGEVDLHYLQVTKNISTLNESLPQVRVARKRERRHGIPFALGDRIFMVRTARLKDASKSEHMEDPEYVTEHKLPIDTPAYLEQYQTSMARFFIPMYLETKRRTSAKQKTLESFFPSASNPRSNKADTKVEAKNKNNNHEAENHNHEDQKQERKEEDEDFTTAKKLARVVRWLFPKMLLQTRNTKLMRARKEELQKEGVPLEKKQQLMKDVEDCWIQCQQCTRSVTTPFVCKELGCVNFFRRRAAYDRYSQFHLTLTL